MIMSVSYRLDRVLSVSRVSDIIIYNMYTLCTHYTSKNRIMKPKRGNFSHVWNDIIWALIMFNLYVCVCRSMTCFSGDWSEQRICHSVWIHSSHTLWIHIWPHTVWSNSLHTVWIHTWKLLTKNKASKSQTIQANELQLLIKLIEYFDTAQKKIIETHWPI